METKGTNYVGTGLLGLFASYSLLWADPSNLPFVGWGIKLIGTLVIVFLSVVVNKLATDFYINKVKNKLFKNERQAQKTDEDEKAA